MQITYQFNPKSPSPDASFIRDLNAAIGIIDSTIKDNITVHLEIGYGVNAYSGQVLSNQNISYGGPSYVIPITYSNLRTDLINAVPGFFNNADLPHTASINGVSAFDISPAQARVFGLLPSNAGNSIDGYVSIGEGFKAGPLRIAAMLHEITHALGREPENGVSNGTTYYSSMDLFRFLSSGGGRDFDGTINPPSNGVSRAYFSLNGGHTDLADFGVHSDPSDFLNSLSNFSGYIPPPPPYSTHTPNDPFDEYLLKGAKDQLSGVDIEMMQALGFRTHPLPNPLPHPVPKVAGVSVATDSSVTKGNGLARGNAATINSSLSLSDLMSQFSSGDGHGPAANTSVGNSSLTSGSATSTITGLIESHTASPFAPLSVSAAGLLSNPLTSSDQKAFLTHPSHA
jgi:hypothetical protein